MPDDPGNPGLTRLVARAGGQRDAGCGSQGDTGGTSGVRRGHQHRPRCFGSKDSRQAGDLTGVCLGGRCGRTVVTGHGWRSALPSPLAVSHWRIGGSVLRFAWPTFVDCVTVSTGEGCRFRDCPEGWSA